MDLAVERCPIADAHSLVGDLLVDGTRFCATLENLALAIPEGRYRVQLTESPAVEDGELWSPDQTGILPLVCDVPEREGIRIHAANEYHQLLGCIAVGDDLQGVWLGRSRAALTRLMDLMKDKTEIWITVLDAPTVGTKT